MEPPSDGAEAGASRRAVLRGAGIGTLTVAVAGADVVVSGV